MQSPVSDEVLKALAVTAEICDRPMSDAAAFVMCHDLAGYPEPQLLGALTRCRRELHGKLTVQAIVSRLDDGRPSADEAWGMVPHSEDLTAVLTDETFKAMYPAVNLYDEGDRAGARVLFRDTYNRLVAENRAKCLPVKWRASLGFDRAGREPIIEAAIAEGKITALEAQAIGYYPMPSIAANALERIGSLPTKDGSSS